MLATWVAVDAGDSVLAWSFAALCVVVTAFVAVQLVRPASFELRLDISAVEVRLPWQRVRVPWERIHLARVVRVVGEPVLELHVWDAHETAQTAPRATGVLLPVGVDLARIHARLERHLGHAAQPPASPHPPDPVSDPVSAPEGG